MSGKLERGAAVFRARFWPGFGPGSGPGYIWSTYACVCLDLTIDRYRRCFLGRERPAPGIYILHIRMDLPGVWDVVGLGSTSDFDGVTSHDSRNLPDAS